MVLRLKVTPRDAEILNTRHRCVVFLCTTTIGNRALHHAVSVRHLQEPHVVARHAAALRAHRLRLGRA